AGSSGTVACPRSSSFTPKDGETGSCSWRHSFILSVTRPGYTRKFKPLLVPTPTCGTLPGLPALKHCHDLLHLLRVVEHPPGGAQPFLPPHAEIIAVLAAQLLAQLVQLLLLVGTQPELVVLVERRRLAAPPGRTGLQPGQLAAGVVQGGQTGFVHVIGI